MTREQYLRLVELARQLYAADLGHTTDEIAKEMYDMCVSIIGQVEPLDEQKDTHP